MKNIQTLSPPRQAIGIGSSASIMLDSGAILNITIKTPAEIDPNNYIISNESPLGSALLKKKVGDKFQYKVGAQSFGGVVLSVTPE